jgi:hypothetical protein
MKKEAKKSRADLNAPRIRPTPPAIYATAQALQLLAE